MERSTMTKAAENWINGAWNDGGTLRQAISPSNGQPLGNYLDIGPEEARRLGAAHLLGGGWPVGGST